MLKQASVLSTDVVVIGGGIAGLCAANKVVDQGAGVLILDKSTATHGGQVPLSGGHFHCIPPDKVEAGVKFIVEEGKYLNDQEWTHAFVNDTHSCIQEMLGWGVPFWKEFDGGIKIVESGGGVRTGRPEMILPTLLHRALRKGAKVLNKVYVVDLLKRDGRVVGIVGFHYQTGDFYVVHSKAIIIACGGCNYKSRPLFHTNCGEGIAMAYNAGAELRNAEFANQLMVSNKFTLRDVRSSRAGTDFYENRLGESMVERYPEMKPTLDPSTPPWMHGMIFRRWVLAFYKEIEAGRGPIYLNLTSQPAAVAEDWSRPGMRDYVHGYIQSMHRLGIDLSKEKVEWTIVPEYHAGPIRIDLNCESTIPGVYATGDATQNGSAFQGSIEGCGLTGGVPLGWAMVSGFRAGTAAGKAAAKGSVPEVKEAELEKLRKEIFAPLDVNDGYSPYDVIQEIQNVVFPIKNCYVKSKDRLEEALHRIQEIKTKLSSLTAKDSHELVRCHEAKSMIPCAEALFRASLMRTETRGTNVREDYPEQDDQNWLKWIIIKKEGEDMKLWTEPVPIGRYKYKPS